MRVAIVGLVVAVIFLLYGNVGRPARRVLVALGGVGAVLFAGLLVWFAVTSPPRDHGEWLILAGVLAVPFLGGWLLWREYSMNLRGEVPDR